jgi:hypothetical protein
LGRHWRKHIDIMIEIKRKWETVEFTSYNKKTGNYCTVELNINRDTHKFTITQPNEEGVRFDKDSLNQAEERLRAVQAAFKYVKDELKNL